MTVPVMNGSKMQTDPARSSPEPTMTGGASA